MSQHFVDPTYSVAATDIGRWLLSIQHPDGSWPGGLYPGKTNRPSVFNTGQILKGMVALFRNTQEQRYLDAANRGANWLVQSQLSSGLWPSGDYGNGDTPSYYTHVAWPMLEVWQQSKLDSQREAAERFLRNILLRITSNGTIQNWGFGGSDTGFTHTIAYTIRGLQECARLTDDYVTYGSPVERALEVIYRKSELTNGRLPGAFDSNWQARGSYVCLTGNAQLAICLLLLEENQSDLRLINAAAKLVDFVCATQNRVTWTQNLKGAVAGSSPLWGGYMRGRYPNWAAKYHCDALLMLTRRLKVAAALIETQKTYSAGSERCE